MNFKRIKRVMRRWRRDEVWSDRRFIAIRRLMVFDEFDRRYGGAMAMRVRRRFPLPLIW